jgi:amino acid transporter
MAIWNRKGSASSQQGHYAEEEKGSYNGDTGVSPVLNDGQAIDGQPTQTKLHRGLKARHITMIAIGGAIGTGLIIGTGKALAQAGPGSILISYTFVGMIVFLVMAALGEMAAWIPLGEGFSGYATRFCDPALGFALGYVSYSKA